jgi:hypothetical protein
LAVTSEHSTASIRHREQDGWTGAHVIFFPRGKKGTTEVGWQEKATRDLRVIEERTKTDPHSNVGVVGNREHLATIIREGQRQGMTIQDAFRLASAESAGMQDRSTR